MRFNKYFITVDETKINHRFDKCKCRMNYLYFFPYWDKMMQSRISKPLPGNGLKKMTGRKKNSFSGISCRFLGSWCMHYGIWRRHDPVDYTMGQVLSGFMIYCKIRTKNRPYFPFFLAAEQSSFPGHSIGHHMESNCRHSHSFKLILCTSIPIRNAQQPYNSVVVHL